MNSPNRDCAETRQYLHLFLGGELDSPQRKDTESHLEDCAPCRRELESARRSRELYLAAAVDADSEALDLWPGIRSRLYGEQLLQPRTAAAAPAPSPFLRRWVPLAGLAAAAALVVTLSIGNRGAVPAPVESPTTVVRPVSTLPASTLAETEAPGKLLLRPVLRGDESLIEREQRLLLEQGQGSMTSHPLEPSLYDVVNQRRLR